MAKKYELATLDFETDPFLFGRVPYPFACGIYTADKYIKFWGDDCARQAAEYLSDKKYNVYAHNGGKFDYFYLLQWLDAKIKMINGRIAKCTIGTARLFDSYLILPLPLAAYKKDEIDYSIMEAENREKPENKKEILKYLHKDCEYLFEWVSKFIDRFGKKLTLAGAAFDQLEQTGYPCKKKSEEFYDDTFRQFYYGGRTQAFEHGHLKGNYKIFDINSAYPSAMLEDHPFGFSYYKDENSHELPKKGVYFATIKAISKGALPFREDKGTYYPIDNLPRDYYASSWEINAGLDTDTLKIIEVREVYKHTETENFKTYVMKFYKEKVQGKRLNDKDLETFAKLMLNSAYGKFGADGRKYKQYVLTDLGETPLTQEEIDLCDDLGITKGEYLLSEEWENVGDLPFHKTLWRKPDPQEDFYNVAVAASITGYVRAFLWRAICQTKKPVYCDTDSIICKDFFGEIDSEKLGAWDFEGETTKEGIYIGGKKLYTCELKGIKIEREKSDEGLTAKEIREKHKNTFRKHKEIKKAHKGARLSFNEIKKIVLTGKSIEWKNDAPSFSLTGIGAPSIIDSRVGARFVKRNIKVTGQ